MRHRLESLTGILASKNRETTKGFAPLGRHRIGQRQPDSDYLPISIPAGVFVRAARPAFLPKSRPATRSPLILVEKSARTRKMSFDRFWLKIIRKFEPLMV